MFLRNAWYVAAWGREISRELTTATILGDDIVMYRRGNGSPVALEDACPHRKLPLSMGRLSGDCVECGYHGLTFDTEGNCVDIPGQKNIPPQAHVQAFPMVERNEILWIWMGDPALADDKKIVEYHYHDDKKKWPHRKAMFQIKSNYMLMIDNLMDLTHLGYVHNKTIGGNPLNHVGAEMNSRQTENGAYFICWMENHEPPPTYQKGGQFSGKVDRWQEFEYVGPSIVLQWSGAIEVGKGAREDRDQEGFHLRLLHAATPETDTTFHYFWSTANGYRQNDPAATEEMYSEIYPTFIEDKVIKLDHNIFI